PGSDPRNVTEALRSRKNKLFRPPTAPDKLTSMLGESENQLSLTAERSVQPVAKSNFLSLTIGPRPAPSTRSSPRCPSDRPSTARPPVRRRDAEPQVRGHPLRHARHRRFAGVVRERDGEPLPRDSEILLQPV